MRLWIPVVILLLVACGCGGTDRPSPIGPGNGTVTLPQVQNSIFTPSCAIMDYHAGLDAPFGPDQSDGQAYGSLVGVASAERPEFDRVDPGNAADSSLFMKVSGDGRIFGDPMPAIGGALGHGDLDILARWIEQGANP